MRPAGMARACGRDGGRVGLHAGSDLEPDKGFCYRYRMGARLAGSDTWRAWSETSELRAVREAQRPAAR